MTIQMVSVYMYRGPRPKSYSDLVPYGITAVIDLESGVYEALHEDVYEHEKPEDFGMKAYHIKCSAVFPPSRKAMREFFAVVSGERKKYVHCLHGQDRTGFMIAAYRMRIQNWTFTDAVKEMFAMGFHKFPYIWWVLFLGRYHTGAL